MKPAAFDYYAPSTVAEAIQLLDTVDDAKVLAGGQSLIPLLNMRLAQPAALIDINGVKELAYIRRENGHLAIGAMTRQRTLELDRTAHEAAPLLAEILGYVGHVTIRNRGTVGGSVAHADPNAELPAAMVVLDASLVLQGPGGSRTVAARDFFTTYLTTALEPNELLTEIRIDAVPVGTGHAVWELARRHGDFALSAVLALIELDDAGRVRSARVAVAGANPVPLRVGAAESLLVGEAPLDSLIEAASAEVGRAVSPTSDVHASADYRRQVTRVLARRALGRAIARAKGGA